MYLSRFQKWGLQKNNKEPVVRAILRKQTERAVMGKDSVFVYQDRPVDMNDIYRYSARKGLSAASPTTFLARTPHGLVVSTPLTPPKFTTRITQEHPRATIVIARETLPVREVVPTHLLPIFKQIFQATSLAGRPLGDYDPGIVSSVQSWYRSASIVVPLQGMRPQQDSAQAVQLHWLELIVPKGLGNIGDPLWVTGVHCRMRNAPRDLPLICIAFGSMRVNCDITYNSRWCQIGMYECRAMTLEAVVPPHSLTGVSSRTVPLSLSVTDVVDGIVVELRTYGLADFCYVAAEEPDKMLD